MTFLDDIEGLIKTRVNRVNPGAGLFRQPEDARDNWLDDALERARKAAEERLAREKREQEIRETYRKQAAKLAEETRKRLTFQPRDENAGRPKNTYSQFDDFIARHGFAHKDDPRLEGNPNFGKPSVSTDENAGQNQGSKEVNQGPLPGRPRGSLPAQDPLTSWILSKRGSLIFKDEDEAEAKKDPLKFLAKTIDPSYRNPTTPEDFAAKMNEVRQRWEQQGLDPASIARFEQYIRTDEGFKNAFEYSPERGRGPVAVIAGDLLGNKTAGDFVSVGGGAVATGLATLVNPALGANVGAGYFGTEGGLSLHSSKDDESLNPRLAMDAANAVGNTLIMGKAGNIVEDALVKKMEEKFSSTVAKRLAVRMMTRAGINVAEDTPLTAAQLMAYGVDPTSQDGLMLLGLQTSMSAAGGAVIPLAGATVRGGAKKAITSGIGGEVATSAASGVAGYGVSGALGADEESQRKWAGAAALAGFGGTNVAKRGIGDALKTGFGFDKFLPKDVDPMTGQVARGVGASTFDASGFDENGWRSKLRDVISAKMQNRSTPDQIRAILKGGGVKQDEIDSTGFGAYLDGLDGRPVPKDEVLAFIGEHDTVVQDNFRTEDPSADLSGYAKYGGFVPGGRGAGDEFSPAEFSKAFSKAVATKPDRAAARAAKRARLREIGLEKLAEAQERSRALPERIKAEQADADDYYAHADASIEKPGGVRGLLSKVGGASKAINGIADPAARFSSKEARHVLVSAAAAANYLRAQMGFHGMKARQFAKALEPLMGDPDGMHQTRDRLTTLGGGLGVTGAGYVAGEATGKDEFKEAGLIAGAITMGALSHRNLESRWANRPWESVKFASPDAVVPEQLRSGSGKLYDIIQNPERYDQESGPAGWYEAVLAYRKLHSTMTRDTNAVLESAGMDVITLRQMDGDADPRMDAHGILQWFTPESAEAVASKARKPDTKKAFRMDTPGFDRKQASELARQLGPTFEAALAAHPELKVIKNPMELISLELKFHDQIRANARLVGYLKNSDSAYKVPTAAEYKGMTPEEVSTARALTKLREDEGWTAMPGIDDYRFSPEAHSAVSKLLMPSRGTDEGALKFFDVTTAVLRQAMFTGDLSAWTMQGAMLAISDPSAVIKNAQHLIGASVMGRKYFDHWVAQNKDLWEAFSKSGGVGGVVHEEFGGSWLNKAPGFKQIEERGFEAFLPIHRALMWQAQNQTEGFLDNLPGGTKIDPLGVKRLSVELLKQVPLIVGTGVALDQMSEDDKWQAVMAAALGLSTSGLARKFAIDPLISKGAGAGNIQSRVNAAKFVNRTGGAFNRQQYGVTSGQAQWERIIGARSPSLFRNTVILASKALADVGPEGAAARFYLVKTAALMATALAAVQYATTGEMPSFDPTDEDSILSPFSPDFMRANMGKLGKASPSNPLLSLVKAFMNTDRPDGVREWRAQDWRPDVGMGRWARARTPDLISPLVKGGNGPQLPIPLVGKTAIEAGMVEQSAIGGHIPAPALDKLGLAQNPSFNHGGERAAGVAATFAGLNVSPESRGGEMMRMKGEAFDRQRRNGLLPDVPDRNGDGVVDYDDLNQEQQEGVRTELDQSKQYKKLGDALEAEGIEKDNPSNVQRYFDYIEDANGKYVAAMTDLDARYRAGTLPPFFAKAEYQHLAEIRRDALKYGKETLGGLPAGRHLTDETVTQYLERNAKPEDKAVAGWYDIYEKATGADGKLNFNSLEKQQAAYLDAQKPEIRAYLENRVAHFDSGKTAKNADNKFFNDYEAAKDTTQPYFDLYESSYTAVAGDGIFAGYATYADFEDAVTKVAMQNGVAPDIVLNSLASLPEMKAFNAKLQEGQRGLRGSDTELDDALFRWYGKSRPKPKKGWSFKPGRNPLAGMGFSGLGKFSRNTPSEYEDDF